MMSVSEIAVAAVGYKCKGGYEVADLYYNHQTKMIVLTLGNRESMDKVTKTFSSKINLLEFLFGQHK